MDENHNDVFNLVPAVQGMLGAYPPQAPALTGYYSLMPIQGLIQANSAIIALKRDYWEYCPKPAQCEIKRIPI